MNTKHLQRWSIGLVLSSISMLGFAHTGLDAGAHHGAFVAALLHPFGGIDHIAAALAVGLWGALVPRRIWVGPTLFVTSMAIGAWAGLQGLQWMGVEWIIASSVLILGVLVMDRRILPSHWSLVAIAIFAFAHGSAHGIELQRLEAATPAIAGLIVSTGLLHIVGSLAAIHLVRQRPWLQKLCGATLSLVGVSLVFGLLGGSL